jgi:hypothetical protein
VLDGEVGSTHPSPRSTLPERPRRCRRSRLTSAERRPLRVREMVDGSPGSRLRPRPRSAAASGASGISVEADGGDAGSSDVGVWSELAMTCLAGDVAGCADGETVRSWKWAGRLARLRRFGLLMVADARAVLGLMPV